MTPLDYLAKDWIWRGVRILFGGISEVDLRLLLRLVKDPHDADEMYNAMRSDGGRVAA